MFVQVIEGKTSDVEGVRRILERWTSDVAPSAPGWLGTTAGVTDDGTLIAVARFESADAARANSDRDEQGQWFAEFTKHLDDDPTFLNCSDVTPIMGGGSDDAGFVQVMQSRVLDVDKLKAAGAAMEALPDSAFGRTDILGGIAALSDDQQSLTQVMYFTSEEEARAGEATPPPPEMLEAMQAWVGATDDNIRYLDLRDPWTASPS